MITENNKNFMGKEGDGEERAAIPYDKRVPCAWRAHRPGRETAFSREVTSEFVILSSVKYEML